jgi:hypothetical protein
LREKKKVTEAYFWEYMHDPMQQGTERWADLIVPGEEGRKSVEHKEVAEPQARRREHTHPMIKTHHATCTELCHAMHTNPTQRSSLSFFYSTVFRTKWSKTQIQRHGGEEYFAFWGFVSEEHIRNKLLALISYVFKTRIIIAANTKQGMFECVCTIDSTTARVLQQQYETHSGRLPATTAEDLLLWFLELFNMSADVIRFERILTLQMVSSIDRLEHATSQLYGNLSSPVVSDFYELYKCKRAYRDDNITARMLTGYELSTDSLCHLCHALRASQNKHRVLKTKLASMQEFERLREAELQNLRTKQSDFEASERARVKTARLVSAFHEVNELAPKIKTMLLEALGLCAVPLAQFVETGLDSLDLQEVLVRAATPAITHAVPEEVPEDRASPQGPVDLTN